MVRLVTRATMTMVTSLYRWGSSDSIGFGCSSLSWQTIFFKARSTEVTTGSALSKKTLQPSPVFSWTGFYLGGNVGGGTSRINFSGTGVFTIAGVADPFAFADSGTASGILAGGQLGFNYELPTHVVLGFEADLDGSSFHGLTTFCSTGTGGPLLGHGANCETSNNKLEQFSTVRGRVGYAFDKVLVYGTGGFAWERSSTSTIATCVTIAGSCPGHGVKFTDGSSEASATLSGCSPHSGYFAPNICT